MESSCMNLRPDPRQTPQEVLRILRAAKAGRPVGILALLNQIKPDEPAKESWNDPPLRVRAATEHEHWDAGGRAPGIDAREAE